MIGATAGTLALTGAIIPSIGATAAAATTTTTGARSPAASPAYPGMLRQGSRGSAVVTLQRALGIAADGDFGPQTRAAVVAFQRSKGLEVDGIVGPATWGALFGGPTYGQRVAYALVIARQQLGKPYVYGGAGPSSFDCSGFVQYSFGRAGIYLPRTADQQYRKLAKISHAGMRAGDVLFFLTNGVATHDGIYIGSGKMIVARRPGTFVQYETLWTNDYRVGRV